MMATICRGLRKCSAPRLNLDHAWQRRLKNARARILQVVQINDYQKQRFVEMVISAMFNTISGKHIAVLGFAFKKVLSRRVAQCSECTKRMSPAASPTKHGDLQTAAHSGRTRAPEAQQHCAEKSLPPWMAGHG